MEFAAQYLDEATLSFRGHKRLADLAIEQLSDEELFQTLDEESNSVAVIVKHMAGNLRSRFRDFLTTDGEKPDRNRDQEFILDPGTTRVQVMGWWEDGWRCLFEALGALAPEDFAQTVYVRGEPHSVLQAINRQLAHHVYHAGQIVFLARRLRGSRWKPLSIPRGQSAAFNAKMAARYK